MDQQTFDQIVKEKIAAGTDKQLLVFAIRLCDNLYPDYELFHEKRNWGSPKLLYNALDYCKAVAFGEEMDIDKLHSWIHQVEVIAPDATEFVEWDGAYARNACNSVINSLHFLGDNDRHYVAATIGCYTNTIDLKIRQFAGEKKLSEQEVDEDPIMHQARRFILQLLG